MQQRCQLCVSRWRLEYSQKGPKNQKRDNLSVLSYLYFFCSPFLHLFLLSPHILAMCPSSPSNDMFWSVLLSGSSVDFFSCFSFGLSLCVSFPSSFLPWQSIGTFLCHFLSRQPLIHVPIIPAAWGPSGPTTKDTGSQASISPLAAVILLLSSLTFVSFVSPHLPIIRSCLFCRSCSVSPPYSHHSSLTCSFCPFICLLFFSSQHHLSAGFNCFFVLRCSTVAKVITHQDR